MKSFCKYITILITSILLLSCLSEKTKEIDVNKNKTLIKKKIIIQDGGSIYNELEKIGISANQIVDIITIFTDNVDLQSVQPGSEFEIIYDDKDKTVTEFLFKEDIVTFHRLSLKDKKYVYDLVEKETEKKLRLIEGIVYKSLDQALSDKNIESNIKQQISNALSSKINLRVNAKKGDYFKAVIEENYYKNTKLKGSKLLYVSYKGITAGFTEGFRYEEKDKKSAFNGMYLANGTAMLSSALRLPLDRIHITSTFGKRIHPISRTWKMHNGIDYRASTGTPVFSIAAGTVIRSNWYGGYGKTIEIRHNDGYISQYAHLSRINCKQGQTVKAGQIIGAVGSTGYSTGAHLHFGIRTKKFWINPKSLNMLSAAKLSYARMTNFRDQISKIKELILKHENPKTDPLEMTILEKYRRDFKHKY